MAEVIARLLTRALAAQYWNVSIAEIDRLIAAGVLHPVRLPAVRSEKGKGVRVDRTRVSRRVLLDREELDRLITASRDDTSSVTPITVVPKRRPA